MTTDPSSRAQRSGIEVAENLEAQFGRKRSEKVDLDQVSNGGGDQGQLRKAALRENALEHEVSVF
jgi:hypothetical protein